MADENPIEQVREELDTETPEEKTARETAEREAAEKAEHEAAEKAAREKHEADFAALDARVTKLGEDVEAWKTQISSGLEKTQAELRQSIRELSEAAQARPLPVEPQNPPPPAEPQNPPPSGADGHPAAKTGQAERKRNLRFL